MRHKTKYSLDSLYGFILKYKKEHGGNSPTLVNMQEALALPSKNTAFRMLAMLEEEGRIILPTDDKQSRSIEIPGSRWLAPGELLDGTLTADHL